MDHLTEHLPARNVGTQVVGGPLRRIQAVAQWTAGTWNFGEYGERRWNSLQNTPSDVRLLTNYLLRVIAGEEPTLLSEDSGGG